MKFSHKFEKYIFESNSRNIQEFS